MLIEVTNHIRLTGCPRDLARTIEDRLTFPNPKWIENDRMGRWNGDTPETLSCFERDPDGALALPRGFARQLIGLCRKAGVAYQIEDRRRTLPEVDLQFSGTLKPFQSEAVAAVLGRDFGTLSAPTGSGKTVMALAAITARKQPAVIVVHTRELLGQWVERIGQFLDIPAAEVGQIGGGRRTIGERITVAMVQSLYKCAGEVAPCCGQLVVDECHRAPSRTFTEAVRAFDCRFMLGLSATPWRRDKLGRQIFWYLGDVVHQVETRDLMERGDILPFLVVERQTDFNPTADPVSEYATMLSELTLDHARNRLIAEDVAAEATNGGRGVQLVLSDRKDHCEALQNALIGLGVRSELLTGDVPAKKRRQIVKQLNGGGVRVLIATGQLIGEGFDCRGLSTLFLATPVKFSGRLQQYLGRVLRTAPGKDRAKVFDYIDGRVGVLAASAKSRRWAYARLSNGDGE